MSPTLLPNIECFLFTRQVSAALVQNGEIASLPGEGAALCGTPTEHIPLSFLRAIPFQISVGFGVR